MPHSAGKKAITGLIDYLEENKNYKLFYDNWFSSHKLTIELLEKGFHSTATIQIRRIKNDNFDKNSKEFKKSIRGTYEELFSYDSRLCLVRWMDSKPVHLISTFLSCEPIGLINRWVKKESIRTDIDCPNIVKGYNKHMGGVDLADMLHSLYRIDRKSKKYYTRIIYYLFGVCMSNAWNIHKIITSNELTLREFTLSVSLSLMKAGKTIVTTNVPATASYNRKKTIEDIR